MPTRNVVITDHQSRLIDELVESGRYQNASEVLREGIRLIEEHGPYEIKGDPDIMRPLDRLLQAFVEQHRMKLPGGSAYVPCYRVVD